MLGDCAAGECASCVARAGDLPGPFVARWWRVQQWPEGV